MKLKHVKNYHPGAQSAVMLIYSDIGDEHGEINGTYFAEEMKYLAQNGVNDISIHINSAGGNVLHGFSILAAIRNFPGNVTTINDGVAASTAGWIFAAGSTRKMVDFGRIMIHNPYVPGKEEEDASQALDQIRKMLLHIFKNNSSLEDVNLEELMEKETWLTADEAKNIGLVDEVIQTTREAVDQAEEIFGLNAVPLSSITNQIRDLSKVFNSTNNPKPYKMENLKNHLKLDKAASEEAVLNAVKKLEDKASEAATKATEATEALDAAKADLEAEKEKTAGLNKDLASQIVDQAIEAGKFKKEKREALIDQAVENGIDGLKAMVEAVAEKPAKIVDHLGTGSGSEENPFKGKTFREIEKAPNGEAYLNKLKSEDKEAYNKLFAAEYGE